MFWVVKFTRKCALRMVHRMLSQSFNCEPMDAEIQGKVFKAVTNFFKNMDLVWYAAGINKLMNRYEKCLA